MVDAPGPTLKIGRPKTLLANRTHFCPGCGHGIVHRLIAEIIEEWDLRGEVIGMAPVGCAVLAYQYLDIDMCEAAHGRTPEVAGHQYSSVTSTATRVSAETARRFPAPS